MTTTRKKLQMEKARALAKDKHAEVANICAELAEIYKRGGEHRNALLEYQDMELMLTKSSASWEGMASVKRAIGEAHLALDETEEAIAQHTEMLALAEATNDTVEVQRAFATIATTYFVVATLNDNDEKMLRKAERRHLRSLELAATVANGKERTMMEMRAQENLGRVFIALTERRLGMEKLITAAEMASDHKYTEDLIRIIGYLRSLALEDNNIESAEDYNNQLFQCLKRDKNTAAGMEEEMFDAYYCQGQINIKSRQFSKAKNNLLRAKRILTKKKAAFLKGDDTVQNLTKDLNAVAKILCILSELERTDDNDAAKKVSLYEKVGDMNSGVAAIWYYEKGVKLCLDAGREVQLAAPLYSSIAAAKMEMSLRNEALHFYEKELDILRRRDDGESDIVRTLLAMSYCLQDDSGGGGRQPSAGTTTATAAAAAAANSASIKLLKDALSFAESLASRSLLGKVLRALIEVYEKSGHVENAASTKNRLSEFDSDSDAAEQDEVEEELVPLSDLELEISDEDVEDDDPSRTRTRKRNYREMAKNEKGETILHRKCQSEGNENQIRKLLSDGHAIDCTDNANFTPLHEACNHGHLHYAKILIGAGANINRQSSLGITPLIDAAAAMNMDMLEYLMEAGAKLHLHERDGWTAADHLEHNIEKLDDDQLRDENAERAQLVLQKMRDSLQKLHSTGHNVNMVSKKAVSTVFVTEDDPEREFPEVRSSRRPSSNRLMPCSTSIRSGERIRSEPDDQNQSRRHGNGSRVKMVAAAGSAAAKDYKIAIAGVGASAKRSTISTIPSTLIPSHKFERSRQRDDNAEATGIMRDWMIDDVQHVHKQKRKPATNKALDSAEISSEELVADDSFQRKRLKLDDEADNFTDAPNVLEVVTDTIPAEESSTQQRWKVKVVIEGRTLLIPIQSPDSNIEWLGSEVAKRFADRCGPLPKLLLTVGDAELHHSDPVISIINGDNQLLYAKIIGWDLKSPEKCYKLACEEIGVQPMRSIELIMSESQRRQNISVNLALDTTRMKPLIRAIKYLDKLVELSLASNKLDDTVTTDLCASLMTLVSLRVLNLSNNRLTSKSIEMLKTMAPETNGVMLPSLKKLDISFNLLGDASASTIIGLCRRQLVSLEELHLSCCLLTSRAWHDNEEHWESLMEERASLKSINLSNNNIEINSRRQYSVHLIT